MKVSFAWFLMLAVLLAVGGSTAAQATYALIWSDEFDGPSLDTSNWNIDIGNGCPDLCGWGNNELEYYRAENVSVTGGNLVLIARSEIFEGYAFTSGKVHTRNKQSFLYGRMEMRAKLPTGGGLWPAFWMMPQDDVYGGWAASGEIDIMESANATTLVGGALHFGGTFPGNTSTAGSYALGGANFADDFHIYAVEWDPDEIRWYVDDVLFMTRFSWQWYSSAAPDNPRAPFDQEFYIILNSAVGGNYTGCLNPGCITADFPQEYLIDYVRVYEDIDNFAPTVTITGPTEADNPPAGDILITAEADDQDGTVVRVEFYNGTTQLGLDSTAPYTYTWSGVTDGCYDLRARAIDDLGGSASDAVDLTVGSGCGQAAFPGPPYALEGRLEIENYDAGGEGVAYHDLDPGNNGGLYRPTEGVDIENCTDAGGGFNVGWIDPGEWLEYSIDVPIAGTYTVEIRVASQDGGGQFHLAFNGTDGTGAINVNATGGWQNWTTLTATVSLHAGPQVMRFVATGPGFNVNYFTFTRDVVADVPDHLAARAILHSCYPNPFNPSTTLSFTLNEPGAATLAIYDVSGKIVRSLIQGETFPTGRHDRVWDGRDQAGQPVAAGVYFYRLEAVGVAQTQRMVLIK